MGILTAEQIAYLTDDTYGLANIRAINKLYRRQEGGAQLERAIRRVRAMARVNGAVYGLEYCYCLESELSAIVNGQY